MKWTLKKTNDTGLLLALYQQVFDSRMSHEEFSQRTEGKRFHGYILQGESENLAGFAMLLGEEQEVELWNCGIIPSGRSQGAGGELVKQVMKAMADYGYSRMRVTTFNRWNIMLRILLKHGFRIVTTEYSGRWNDVAIILMTEISPRREIRYALTEECNFQCLFCHNEGLGHERRDNRSDEEVLGILEEAVRLGYTDITLTGGEPLLKKKRLFALLEGFERMPFKPALTVVTNGSLLDDEIIQRLAAYSGEIKLNISCHATDAENFARLTGKNDLSLFDRVNTSIRSATEAGLRVKMNCVLIKGVNHDRVVEAAELARSLGASAIKFIELLVLPDSPTDYELYYDVSAIHNDLKKIALETRSENPRRATFVHREDARFQIEAQKCTCAFGCSHCRELRDRTFSSDLHYHPCFVRHKSAYPIETPGQVGQTFLQGDRIIDGYAYKYRDSSPTLIEKEVYIPAKVEYYFEIDSMERFREFLKNKRFSLTGKKGYYLEHYWPRLRSSEWEEYRRILKIGWDSHDKSKVSMIYTDHTYRPVAGLGLETTTRYLDDSGPITFDSETTAKRFLDRMDFEHHLTLELDLETLKLSDITVSLALGNGKSTVKINGSEEIARSVMQILKNYEGNIKALEAPFARFMG